MSKEMTREPNPLFLGLIEVLRQQDCQCELYPENNENFESLEVTHLYHRLEMWFNDVNKDLGPSILVMKTNDLRERSYGDVKFINLTLPETDIVKISLGWLFRGKRP